MNCNFSIKHFEECLSDINKSKYKNIMIHDVDIWTNNMIDILNLEIKYDINSIWFFRFHAKNYNLLSYDVINFIKKFKNLNKIKLGIHLEPFYFNEFNIVSEQVSILEKILNESIKYASIHEPTRFPVNIQDNLNNLELVSYNSKFVQDKKYISDSSSNWREGCMCNHINKKDLVILTHPNWWYNEYSGEVY